MSLSLESLYTEELYKIGPRVLVIIPNAWSEIPEECQSVLAKMLVAVKLNLAAVQIVTRKEFALEDLAPLAPTRVLVFGSTLTTSSALYEHFTSDGISVILSESLEKLDDGKKKSLWMALRQMFNM